jgi:hypothetical protein
MMNRKLTQPIIWRLEGDAESEGFWVGAGVVDRRLDGVILDLVMARFISLTKNSKWFWYGLLAIITAIDVVTLIDPSGPRNFLRIYWSLGIVTVAILFAVMIVSLLVFWQWRSQKIPPNIQRRKFLLAWCWGSLRGGWVALAVMPLLMYEEFEGPGFIIFVIRALQGCKVGTCVFGVEYMFARLMVLSMVPFVLGLTAAIVFARKSWRNCIKTEMDKPASP